MLITRIQRFSTHDGPGIRTCVFFKGCPLSCFWCHNPENKSFSPDISFDQRFCISCGACVNVCPYGCHSFRGGLHIFDRTDCIRCGKCASSCPSDALSYIGKEMTPSEIFEAVKADIPFYGDKGGVTLTGGEPLAFRESLEVLKLCNEADISCCFETSGAGIPSVSAEAASLCDTFFVDLKDNDPERHFRNTGEYPDKILANIRLTDKNAKNSFVLRAILVKNVNLDEGFIDFVRDVYRSLKNCAGVELVPYHGLYGNKYTRLGLPDRSSADYIPSKEDLDLASSRLKDQNVTVIG